MTGGGIALAERGLVPDGLTRWGIRRLLRRRLKKEDRGSPEANREALESWVDEMRSSPLALHVDSANEQHYEVPTAFFRDILGPQMKYSSCYYPSSSTSLSDAEEAMLEITAERAGIEEGMDILELGCGWGSLTLYMARKFPGSNIVAVSNSSSQKQYIMDQAARRGLPNVEVITKDMNEFDIDRSFDRVVSVEMFEHMRNYEELFERIAGWLAPGGKLFFHIFVHDQLSYPFEAEGEEDWMARHFFTGGMMPSFDLPTFFQDQLRLETSWKVNGTHYARTAEGWLENLDRNRDAALAALADHPEPRRQLRRWRLFFMACAELFGRRRGEEWYVGHYLFERVKSPPLRFQIGTDIVTATRVTP